MFIKYEKNIPVAYLGIQYVANLHYDGAWIDLIAVIEEKRNQKIGSELVKFAEKRVKEKGKKRVRAGCIGELMFANHKVRKYRWKEEKNKEKKEWQKRTGTVKERGKKIEVFS